MDKVKLKSEIKRLWKGVWQIADPPIWIGSAVPMIFATVLAYTRVKTFNIFWFVLALAGIFLIETGKNAVNEVVDYRSGADRNIDAEHATPFSGGKKTITRGVLSIKENILVALGTMAAAGAIGLAFVLFRQFDILYIGVAGAVLSILYSLPPFKFCYRGLGELAVGITFGPLMVSGMYLAMSLRLDWFVWVTSLPFAFLIANVLWINEYPDYEADKAANKKNLVVRLGKRRAVYGYAAIFAAALVSVIVIAAAARNAVWLIGLLTAPLMYKAVRNCAENYDNIQKLVYSNAKTIQIYVFMGILLSLAAVFDIIL